MLSFSDKEKGILLFFRTTGTVSDQ